MYADAWQGFFRGGRHTLTRSGGGIFWTRPKACRGSPRGGSGGRSPPDAGKICKIFYKKNPMKNYNFRAIFQNFNEKFAIFTKFFKNFSKFSRKFGEKLELCSCRGFRGAEPPGHRRKFQNFKLKTNEKLQF